MSKHGWKKKIYLEVLPVLVAAHPLAIFPKDSPHTLPLKIGVMRDLVAAHPELKPFHLQVFVGSYTDKTRYQRALLSSSHRVGLDGLPAQEVNAKHRERARAVLAERKKAEESRRAKHGAGSASAGPS